MSRWIENVRSVTPYVPGEQPLESGIIKLNTNENPYPPSPAVREMLASNHFYDELRKYPDPAVTKLTCAIADHYKVPSERVFVGVGSDDVLAMSFLTFFNSKKPILFADITYSFYDVWADCFYIPWECVPLREDFTLDKEGYFKENGGIVIANPNAPTGIFEDIGDIEDIVRGNPDSVVIVDEAYIDFGAKSMLPLIDKYDNLLVVQTFSKSRSMAGSRIGFAIGNEKMIQSLRNVKYSFNSYTMDRITIELGAAAISDDDYFRETCRKIVETREWAKNEFCKLGFNFLDSQTNFIFASHKTIPARELFEALKGEGIYVRYFDRPRIDNYLRITIGTFDEMEALFAFLERYVGKA